MILSIAYNRMLKINDVHNNLAFTRGVDEK